MNPLPCPGCLIIPDKEHTPDQLRAIQQLYENITRLTNIKFASLYIHEDGETVGHVYAIDEHGKTIRKVAEIHQGTFVISEKGHSG
jgi:hypothetical protein